MKKLAKNSVRIFEVGPRDGLQNEKIILSLKNKLWLCQALQKTGLQEIEAGALVRPDRVPQMADSEKLQNKLLQNQKNFHYWYLVPNEVGLMRAEQAKIKKIALFTAASETFNQKNIGMSIADSLKVIEKVFARKTKGQEIRVYLSTVWGCPFEGRMPIKKSAALIKKILKYPEVEQLSIGDTIGVANPQGVRDLFKILKLNTKDLNRVAVHFHDTRGTALANVLQAYQLGIRTFDASIGGLGGCPFAPGASGNLATEDVAYLFKEMGVSTGIHYDKLCEVGLELSKRMKNRPLVSRALQAYQKRGKKTPWDQQ